MQDMHKARERVFISKARQTKRPRTQVSSLPHPRSQNRVRVGSQDPLRTAPPRTADVEPGPSRREPASSSPLISTSRRLSADSQELDTSYNDCERRVRFEELIPTEPPIAEAIGHVSPTTTIDYWLDSPESLNAGRVVDWTDGLELQTEDVPYSASEMQYPPIDFGEGLGLDFGSTNYGAVQVYTSPSLSSPGVNSAYINAYASQSFSPGSWTLPTAVQEQISPLFDSVLDTLIKPQLEIFFIRVYPMIPIYTRDEILAGLRDRRQLRRPGFVALVLSMAALSLVHPLPAGEMTFKPIRGQQATILMDEACRLVASWDHGCDPSVEGILISYLMFGTLFELGHAAGARLRLKEAVTMGEAMHLDLGWGYQSCTVEETARRTRLFWVLAITERAYALQREGSIIFGGSISRPTVSTPTDSSGQLLHYLAIVFSHIDQEIVSCWNGRCGGTKCSNLSQKRAVKILRELKGTAKKVFGDALLPELNETQKADLLITWQWIRNRIWRLASLHGFSTEDGEPELSVEYVLDIARTALGICERLSSGSMEAHGIGFVSHM